MLLSITFFGEMMRLLCKTCGDYTSHFKNPEATGWVCEICKTERPEPEGLVGDSDELEQ